MVECGVVRYAHRTCGSSSAQAPFASCSLRFSPANITLLAASTCPLAWGCSTEVNWCFMFKSATNFLKPASVNWVPLSMVMDYGTPNLVTIFLYRNF